MEYIVGITLALLFCGAAAGLGMDRERVFYPAVLIAIKGAVPPNRCGHGRARSTRSRHESRHPFALRQPRSAPGHDA